MRKGGCVRVTQESRAVLKRNFNLALQMFNFTGKEKCYKVLLLLLKSFNTFSSKITPLADLAKNKNFNIFLRSIEPLKSACRND